MQLIAVLFFISGIFICIKVDKPTIFSYGKLIIESIKKEKYFDKLTSQEIDKLTPKLKIGVSYDRKGAFPLEIYNFSISQIHNPDSVPLFNLTMRIAFNGVVQEIVPSLTPSYGKDVSSVILFEGMTKGGDKVSYRPDTSQLLEDRGISVSVQRIDTEKGKLNTNVINFYTKEWHADALFWSFITVNPLIANQDLLDNIAEGTYEGTYDYYIEGEKYTENFKGEIKGLRNEETRETGEVSLIK